MPKFLQKSDTTGPRRHHVAIMVTSWRHYGDIMATRLSPKNGMATSCRHYGDIMAPLWRHHDDKTFPKKWHGDIMSPLW